MSDVARHVGVSRQLVSLVLRGSPGPSEVTRERVLAAAHDLGYRTNSAARLLRQKRTHLLGAVFSMQNPFEVRVVERLFGAAAAQGLHVVPAPVTNDRPAAAAMEELLGQRVEAVVGFLPDHWTPGRSRRGSSVPVVRLGGPASGADDVHWDNVHMDNRAGMELAVAHLLGLGHRRICHVSGPDDSAGRDRASAYAATMRSAGLQEAVDVVPGSWTEEAGAAAARTLSRRPDLPTAVVCASDQIAVGLLAVLLTRSGLRVPDDVSVIGWDDSDLAARSFRRLTSVRQEVDDTVEATLDLVTRRLADPRVVSRRVLTRASLTARSTTAITRGPARSAGG